MDKLPNELIILIISKLYLCRYKETIIHLVSKDWNKFYYYTIKNCDREKYGYCKNHYFNEMYDDFVNRIKYYLTLKPFIKYLTK